MRRVLSLLDGMPRKMRWVLCFPIGIIASFFVIVFVQGGFNAYWGNPRPLPGAIEISVIAFIADFTRTLFPAVISPRPAVVGLIMFVLSTLLRMVPIYTILTHEYMRSRLPGAIPLVAAGVVGGLVGLLLVMFVMNPAKTAPGQT